MGPTNATVSGTCDNTQGDRAVEVQITDGGGNVITVLATAPAGGTATYSGTLSDVTSKQELRFVRQR